MDEFDNSQRWQGQGPDSIEQRRRILRSLGAGGAIAGAPTLALATGRPHCKRDGKKYHATASAVGSMMGSVVGTTPPKWGHGCSHYTSGSNWSSGWHNGKGRAITWDLCGRDWTGTKMRFFVAFELSHPGTGSPKYAFCKDIIRSAPNSDEAVWLTALFNANKVASQFPYTPGGIIDLYKNSNPLIGGATDSSLHFKALTLFREYLSQGMPT